MTAPRSDGRPSPTNHIPRAAAPPVAPMPEVLLPDGTVCDFPDTMTDDEIAEVIVREFLVEPRPDARARRMGASTQRNRGHSQPADRSLCHLRSGRFTHGIPRQPHRRARRCRYAASWSTASPAEGSPALSYAPATNAHHDVERHIRMTEGRTRQSQRAAIAERRARQRCAHLIEPHRRRRVLRSATPTTGDKVIAFVREGCKLNPRTM
jgi:hypothetical protein